MYDIICPSMFNVKGSAAPKITDCLFEIDERFAFTFSMNKKSVKLLLRAVWLNWFFGLPKMTEWMWERISEANLQFLARHSLFFWPSTRKCWTFTSTQTFFARTLQERKGKSGNSSFLMAFFCHSKKFINKILFKLSDRFSLFALAELVISTAENH